MAEIFLGEPTPNVKQFIIDHYGSSQPAEHADTWYKYASDVEWRTVSITGTIESSMGDEGPIPTTQIPNVENVVALEIGTDVTSIGDSAFSGCNGLTSVTIGNNVTAIYESAFAGCMGLMSITIPNSVTTISTGGFGGCAQLESVTIPDSVTSIGEYAFIQCNSLTSVTIVANGGNAASVKQKMIDAGVDSSITWNMPS